MAQVTATKVVEGSSHVVVAFNMVSDGSGELNNYVIFSPSDLNPPRPNNQPTFRIVQLWYGCVWFDVSILFASNTPRLAWTIARDCDSHNDFRSFGGFIDYQGNPAQADYSGQLMLSTNEFGTVGSVGTITMELRLLNNQSAAYV